MRWLLIIALPAATASSPVLFSQEARRRGITVTFEHGSDPELVLCKALLTPVNAPDGMSPDPGMPQWQASRFRAERIARVLRDADGFRMRCVSRNKAHAVVVVTTHSTRDRTYLLPGSLSSSDAVEFHMDEIVLL
jgi:hypothetical protein